MYALSLYFPYYFFLIVTYLTLNDLELQAEVNSRDASAVAAVCPS